jgi:SAM-dependent methyltransferase
MCNDNHTPRSTQTDLSPKTKKYFCRSCHSLQLVNVLSLGETPLANSLLRVEQLHKPEAKYPLDLVFCSNCSLVQITETVEPERLFREYLYFSSFSETMLNHARTIAHRLIRERELNAESLVIEVGSNDGYLLQYYQQAGVPVLGIEPARNIAEFAEEKCGIPTLCEFFEEGLARKLVADGKRADVIHLSNVFAHVPDINGTTAGIRSLLKDNGIAVIETPYVKDMIDQTEFDTIYHEHLYYYSLTALGRLFRRHSLTILDVERLPIHGGSLRVFVGRDREQNALSKGVSSNVLATLEEEAAWGVDRPSFYLGFGARVEQLRSQLVNLLQELKKKGKKIAAYGASAKGSTLLNYFGIGPETLDFVVDRSHFKQGLYTPGTHLPIYAPEKLLEEMPDYVLLLTWNFADEILKQQAAYQERGGRFVIPIPHLTIVPND